VIVPLLISLPFIGGMIGYFVSKYDNTKVKAIALTTTLLELFLALWFLSELITGGARSQTYSYWWMKSLNINFTFGIDGLTVAMVLLTGLIFVVSVVSARDRIKMREGTFYALLLFMEAGLMGVFTSFNLIIFYIFWEIVLIPAFFLVGIYGGKNREYAALKLFMYTHLGSLFMLIGILMLYFYTGSFNIYEISKLSSVISPNVRTIIFVLLFIGFAVKIPLVPFHSWLPDAYTEAPYPVSIVLSGLLSKMGLYGLIRLGITLLPLTYAHYAEEIAIFGLVTIFYAAFSALAQKDIKRLVAFSSLSHVGFITLGIASLSLIGLNGAIFQMVSHGLMIALLFLLVGLLRRSTGTSSISKLRGFVSKNHFVGWFLVFASLASLGLPGLSGFVGEITILMGTYETFSIFSFIAILSLPLTAGYYLWMLQRSAFGTQNERVKRAYFKIKGSEAFVVVVLAILIACLGFYPASLMHLVSATSQTLLKLTGGI